MRKALWDRLTVNVRGGERLPLHLLIAYALLFPIKFFCWSCGNCHGYQPETDTWLIDGVRFSSRGLRMLASATGQLYRITRDGDVVTLELVESMEDLQRDLSV